MLLSQICYPEAMEQAKQLLLEDAMYKTDILLLQGMLKNLNIETQDGIKRTIHCSVGRFGCDRVAGIYHTSALPVISSKSKLAELIF